MAEVQKPEVASKEAAVVASKALADQYAFGDEQVGPAANTAPSVREPEELASTPAPPSPTDGRFRNSKGHLLSETSVDLAHDLGWTDDEIKSMSSAELNSSVRMAFRTLNQKNATQKANEQAFQPQPAPPAQPEEPDDHVDWGDEVNEQGETVKVTEEKIYKPVNKVVKELTKRVKQLEKQLNATGNYLQRKHVESVTEKIDRAFEEMGPEYHGIFGQGPVTDFDPKSAEIRRRKAVLDSLGIDPSTRGYVQKLKQAAKDLFGVGSKTPPAAEPEPAVSPEDWLRGSIPAPTHREPPAEPYGVKRAEASVRRMKREQMATEPSDEDILNGFPS